MCWRGSRPLSDTSFGADGHALRMTPEATAQKPRARAPFSPWGHPAPSAAPHLRTPGLSGSLLQATCHRPRPREPATATPSSHPVTGSPAPLSSSPMTLHRRGGAVPRPAVARLTAGCGAPICKRCGQGTTSLKQAAHTPCRPTLWQSGGRAGLLRSPTRGTRPRRQHHRSVRHTRGLWPGSSEAGATVAGGAAGGLGPERKRSLAGSGSGSQQTLSRAPAEHPRAPAAAHGATSGRRRAVAPSPSHRGPALTGESC